MRLQHARLPGSGLHVVKDMDPESRLRLSEDVGRAIATLTAVPLPELTEDYVTTRMW